jgi:WD40 repeat protein/energy-coupling factor transporter ATP-binding protein EcfA2
MRELDRIDDMLAHWTSKIKGKNKKGMTDINKRSENAAKQLLNLIYGYKLINLNDERPDYPGIDLGDRTNKIAFQITSKISLRKIKKDLQTLEKADIDYYTNGIFFLFLTIDRISDKKKKTWEGKTEKLVKERKINFEPSKHLLTLDDLNKKIEDIYEKDYDRFKSIKDFLEDEFYDREISKPEKPKTDTNPSRGVGTSREKMKEKYHAFLCYNKKDKLMVEQIAEWLKVKGKLSVWLDNSSIKPGRRWQEEIEEALDRSECCVIFLGPYGISDWQNEEMRIAQNKYVSEKTPHIIPVLLPGAADSGQVSKIPSFLKLFQWVEFHHNCQEEEKLKRLESGIKDIITDPSDKKTALINPFRGLEVFREEDQQYFFGREDVVQQLMNKLKKDRFLAVLGPSGCGKSSVVQAGLIPLLRKQSEVILFTPGERPIEELAVSLRDCYPGNQKTTVEKLISRLRDSDESLHIIAREIINDKKKNKLVVVIDQFEELFIPRGIERKHKKFFDVVLNAVKIQKGPVTLIITMLSDFEGKCTFHSDLNIYVSKHSFKLEHMRQEQLQHVIIKPAKRVGLEFEDDLVDRILDDIKSIPDKLPHLEHGLLELFNEKKGTIITFQDYNNIGGIAGALVKRVESEFSELNDDEKEILRKMFVLRLIQPGEGTEDTRRRATQEELLAVGGKSKIAENLLYRWTRAHLLTEKWDTWRQKYLVEVAHEALIRKWDRIETWMADDGETARQVGILRHDALEWERAEKKDSECLAHGARLTRMEALIQTHKGDLTETEIEFLDASIEQREKEKREKEEARKKVERQRKIKFRITAMAGIILFLIAVMFFIQKNRSDREYIEALSNGLASKSFLVLPTDNMKAIRIAEAGYKMRIHNPLPSTQEALSAAAYSTFERPFYVESMQHEDRVINGIFSPDGTKILTISRDYTAKLWDLRGNPLPDLHEHIDDMNSAAFSPDGTKIITASDDHTAKLWNLSGKLLANLDMHTDDVFSAVFSPDGTKILTASKDHTAKLWDSDGKLLADLNKHTARLDSAIFSPGGSKILTLSWDNTAKLWDLSGKLLADLNGHDDYVTSAVFSPDGSKIVTASWDNTAKLWDLNGRILADLKHTDYVWDAVFSPDSTKIVTASSDRTAKLWDLNGKPLAELKHSYKVWGAIFSPDGTKILTRSENAVKLWELDGKLLTDLNLHKRDVSDAVFSPDGSKIVTWLGNTVKLWDLNGNLLSRLNHTSYVSGVAFSSDGKTILTCSGNSAKLWNLEDNFVTDLNKHKDGFTNAVISPDGSNILFLHGNTTQLWNQKGIQVAKLVHDSPVLIATFSPNGKKILTASCDNKAKLWGLNGQLLTPLKKYTDGFNSATFSPDGSKILTVSHDYTVELWDLNGYLLDKLNENRNSVDGAILSPDGEKMLTWSGNSAKLWDLKENLLADFNEHTDDINNAVFSLNGKKIVTTSKDGTAKLWDLDGKLLADLKGHTDGVSGAVFSRDGSQILTASEDDTAKLWDLEGNLLGDLNRHGDDVLDAAFSSDGSWMITVSKDGTVKSWYTPEAIIQWLKTAPIPKLTKKDKEELGIAEFKID